MIYPDETQRLLRERKFITDTEIVILSGDLIIAENVLTKDRRILNKSEVGQFLNNKNISESKSKSTLLKG
tara:strand:+ start:295 stop:504 length:210 start_codon:yes stop_codon:yes gene_type:complete